MSESSKPIQPKWLSDLLDQEFILPSDPGFVSKSMVMSYAHFIALSEYYLPAINSRPDFVIRKLERKFDQPFTL